MRRGLAPIQGEMKQMMRIAKVWMPAVASLSILLATTGCSKLKARDQLNKGVQAYKNARYEEASSIPVRGESGPSLTMTHMYLATRMRSRWFRTRIRRQTSACDRAVGLTRTAEIDPNNVNAIKGVAAIYFGQARRTTRRLGSRSAGSHPKIRKRIHIGVIDWNRRARTRWIFLRPTVDGKASGRWAIPKKDARNCGHKCPLVDEDGFLLRHRHTALLRRCDGVPESFRIAARQRSSAQR